MAAMRTVLVVDDEAKIVQLARDYLEHAGFAVLTAADGPTAVETARRQHPDLVVLDLGLPGLDGLEVTRELRRDSSIPIVMLTARDDELDKLLGLEMGADDYLTKPFSPRELVARVKAVLRRTERTAEPGDVIRAADVVLDVPRMRAEVAGRTVDLTATEFGLLATLAGEPGPHLHALPAPRRAPWRRVRVVRAGDRFAHQEPAPQGRAGPARTALRADGLWRGLPIRRRPGNRHVTGPGEPDAPKDPATPPPGRADRGRHGPWEHGPWEHGDFDRRDPFARHMRARARMQRRHAGRHGPGPWGGRQGFGCVFGFLFLLIVASIVAVLASFLSSLGPLEIVIAAVAAIAILATIARGLIARGA